MRLIRHMMFRRSGSQTRREGYRSVGITIPTYKTRHAFTLIEMRIVISIISVLLGMLYGSLERARKFSRRAVAYTEVKNIEAAFKQYYAHYHGWPPSDFINALSRPLAQGEDLGFLIDAEAARMLQGTLTDTDQPVLRNANPDRIPFIEFSRFSTQSQGQNIPVNPFRVTSDSIESRQYKVLFDIDNDNEIIVTDPAVSSYSTNVFKTVVVWTVIPGIADVKNEEAGRQPVSEEVLGSWESFNAK